MRYRLMLLSILLLPHLALAVECNQQGSQAELNQCAFESFAVADKKLNQTWQALLQQYKNDKIYTQQLRKAQKAWLAFQDAELAAMFACEDKDMHVCWGSMYPISYYGAKTTLTEERARRLQLYLDEGRTLNQEH